MTNEEKLITGNKKLDLEHQQILSTLAKLQEPLTKAQRILLCEILLQYISEHIEDEESFMKLKNYPDIEKHIDNHYYIQKETLRHFSDFINADIISTKAIYDLFHNHIIDYDIPMIKSTKKKKKL